MPNQYLFLLSSLPPSGSANGICVKKIIETFPDLKKIHAITIEDGSPKNDLGIDEIRVPQRHWEYVCSFGKKRKKSLFVYLIRCVLLLLKRFLMLPIWPVLSLTTCFYFFKESSVLIKKNKITHVVAICYPGETLISMILLKLRFGNKIKTIMYPLDVTLGGKYDGYVLENRLSVFFSSVFYRICACFADKIIVLENALELYEKKLCNQHQKFEICGLPLIEKYPSIANNINRDDIQLVYGGNIIPSIRNPDFLFDLLNSCALKNQVGISIHIYGAIGNELLEKFVLKYNAVNFIYHGWVSEDVLTNAINQADALISVGNNVGHLIPSKIFKYISLKKPIIHLSFIEDDPCLPYLEKYGHSFIVKNGERRELALISWLLSEDNEIEIDCEEIFYRCTPRYTAEKIQF